MTIKVRAGMFSTHISIPQEAIQRFCETHGIQRLALFGSVVRDDFTPQSDIDVLVEFIPQVMPTYFDMAAYEAQLTELFGRQVDLRTHGELSQYFVENVQKQAVTIYERE